MKKLISILIAAIALSGCSSINNSDNNTIEPTTEAEATTTADEAQDEFTQDDFVLFADIDGSEEAVIWLGMEKAFIEDSRLDFPEYFEGIDTVSYKTQQRVEDGKATQETVDYASLISYTGSREYLKTEKGIITSGLYGTASQPNSTAADVIAAYGLDPQNESIYIGNPDDDNYTIAIYFNIDNHNRVTRVISPVGADISDIANVSSADYFIRFMVMQNEVTGVQLFRR